MKYSLSIIFIVALLLNSCGKSSNSTQPVRKNVTETVFASGALTPENEYNLTAQSDGYLVELNFKEGDTVSQGSVLAVIQNEQYTINAQSAGKLLSIATENVQPNAPALKQLEANIELAKQKLKQDELQEERYRNLLTSNSVSKLEYENARLAMENSKANLNALQENYKQVKRQAEEQLIIQKSQKDVNNVLSGNNEIRAVIGGKVYKKMKELGDYVRKGDVIAVIGNKNDFYAKLSVDENNIAKVREGQKVAIQFNSIPEHTYNAVITQIYPAFDEQTQSFYCKAKFTESLDFEISGSQLQANIIIGIKNNILVIPREYLGFSNSVNVKGKGDVKVKTGFVSNEWVEILDGLNENSVIVKQKK